MATVTHAVATNVDTANTPNSSSSFTPVAGDLLVVITDTGTSTSTALAGSLTASANGITFTPILTSLYNASADKLCIFVADQLVPASPVAMTVTWTPSDTGQQSIHSVFRVAGMTRTGLDAIRQFKSVANQASGGTPSITFNNACLTGNPTILAIGVADSTPAFNAPTGWTETSDIGGTSPAGGLWDGSRDSGFTGTTATWNTTAGGGFTVAALELDSSVPPPNHPSVVARSTSVEAADTTSHDVTIPAGDLGDMLIAFFVVDGVPTCTASAGWTKMGQQDAGTTMAHAVFWKWASVTDTLTVTTSSSEQSSHVVLRIEGGDTPVGTSAFDDTAPGTSNPPANTPAAGTQDYLWIAAAGTDGNTDYGEVPPTDYTNFTQQIGATANGVTATTAERQLTNPTQNPVGFSASTSVWANWTLAVAPRTYLQDTADDFDDNAVDLDKWVNNYGVYSETGGRARVQCDTSFNGFETSSDNKMLGSVWAEVFPAATNGATTEASTEMILKSLGTADGTNLEWIYNAVTGELRAQDNVSFVDAGATVLTYSSTTHRWWRIRVTPDFVYWDTSPDGVTWTNRRAKAAPAYVTASDCHVSLQSHRNNGTTNFTEFDNWGVVGTVPDATVTPAVIPCTTTVNTPASVGETIAAPDSPFPELANVHVVTSGDTSDASTLTTSSFSPTTGDWLVVKTLCGSTVKFNTPVANTMTLDWRLKAFTTDAETQTTRIQIWVACILNGGVPITISATPNGSAKHTMIVEHWQQAYIDSSLSVPLQNQAFTNVQEVSAAENPNHTNSIISWWASEIDQLTSEVDLLGNTWPNHIGSNSTQAYYAASTYAADPDVAYTFGLTNIAVGDMSGHMAGVLIQSSFPTLQVGGVTDTTAKLLVRSLASSVRVAIDTDPLFGSPTYVEETSFVSTVATFDLTGLTASTQYYYALEEDGQLNTHESGQFRTFAAAGTPMNAHIVSSSCARGVNHPGGSDEVSNSPVFDLMRLENPDLTVHTGDAHYRNINEATAVLYRQAWHDVLNEPRQAALYRAAPLAYMWDDHDWGANDSDALAPGATVAKQFYRDRVASYPVPASTTDPVYQSWTMGRVLHILTDNRAARETGVTAFGATQKAWFENLLATSNASFLIWWDPTPFLLGVSDRAEMGGYIVEHGWAKRCIVVSGDYHGLAMDSGANNLWGGFPTAIYGSIDSITYGSEGPGDTGWDQGQTSVGSDRWGTVDVTDTGTSVLVDMRSFINSTQQFQYQVRLVEDQGPIAAAVSVPTPTVTAVSGAVVEVAATSTITATRTATAVRALNAVASLAPTATLTATAVRAHNTTASLSPTATVTATAVRAHNAAATLSPTATLTATAVRAHNAAASLAPVATLTATAARALGADASLTSTATVTAAAASGIPVDAALGATAALTATAARGIPTDASLAVTAAVTASVAIERPVDASVTADAQITAASTVTAVTAASVTGTATITADAFVGLAPVTVQTSRDVVASVTAAVAVERNATATLTATAARTATAAADYQVAVTRSSIATITAVASVGLAPITAAAIRAATAAITASAGIRQLVAATQTVTATRTATAALDLPANATLGATATLTATATADQSATVTRTVDATITAFATVKIENAVDVTVDIGPTRIAETTIAATRIIGPDVAATRQDYTVADTREHGTTVDDIRILDTFILGPTRQTAEVDDTRLGFEVSETSI